MKNLITLAIATLTLAGSAFAQNNNTCSFTANRSGDYDASAPIISSAATALSEFYGYAINGRPSETIASITFSKDGGESVTWNISPNNTAARRLPNGEKTGNWTFTVVSQGCTGGTFSQRFAIANNTLTPLTGGSTTPIVTPPTGNACIGAITMGAKNDGFKPLLKRDDLLVNRQFAPAAPDWGLRQGDRDTLVGVTFVFENAAANIRQRVDKNKNEAGRDFGPTVTGNWTIAVEKIEGCSSVNVPTVPFTVTDENTPIPSQTLGTVTVIGSTEVPRGGTLNLFINGPSLNAATLRIRLTLNQIGASPIVTFLELFGIQGNPGRFFAPVATNALIGSWTGVVVDANGNVLSFPFYFLVFSPSGGNPPPVGNSQCGLLMDFKLDGVDMTLAPGSGYVPVLRTGTQVDLKVRSNSGRALSAGISNTIVGNGVRDTDGTVVVPAPFVALGAGLHEALEFFNVEGCGQVRARFRLAFADVPLSAPVITPDPSNVYEVGRTLKFRLAYSTGISAWVSSSRGIDAASDQQVTEGGATISLIEYTPTSEGDYSLMVHQEGSGRFPPLGFFSVRRPQ